MRYIFLFVLLFAIPAHAEVRWFKDKPLFTAPLAYPRSSGSSLALSTSRYHGQRILYIDAEIGKEFPVATWNIGDIQMQGGLEASTWVTLGYPQDGLAFPLLTQDFHFAFPLSARYKRWSGAIKFNHISAHKGDGMDNLVEESLSDSDKKRFAQLENMGEHNGVDVSLIEPLPYSRDFFSGHIAYEYDVEGVNYRHYAQIGYAHKIIPDELNPWFIGSGIEVTKDFATLTPFFAQDVTWNGDVDSVDLSTQLGTYIMKDNANLFNLGFFLSSYIGSDRRGQLLGRKMKQFSIGFFIR